MKYLKSVLALGLLSLVLGSCKDKDDTTSTYKSLSGSLEVGDMPSYVNPGDKFSFESKGVSIPDSETDKTLEFVYTYKNSSDNIKDTTSTYSVVIPEMTGTYTVTATAELKGYYTKTVTLTSVVVSDKSLTSIDMSALSKMTDERDSKTYHITKVGSTYWMAQNLAYYEKDADGKYVLGRPYNTVKATEDIMGGYYSWTDAQRSCPSGWRIPTMSEWESLGSKSGDLMCDAYFNGERLWEFYPEVNKTNRLNFFAMPFGYATIVDDEYSFEGFNDYAFYWADDSGTPVCMYMFVSTPGILEWKDVNGSDFAAQLRCVKE